MDFIAMDQAVQELAGKIVVKRRDNESALRAQQGAIDKNEEIITSLRERVKVRRRDLAKMLNKDKEVIETALGDPKHRFQRLQCKRYDGDTAKQELNEDLCNEIKRLNHVKYQKECRRKRLADLELTLRDYFLLQESNFEEEDQMELRRLKSGIDKMIMKRNTAKYIHSTYTKSLRQLTKTRSNVQNDLEQLHVELKKQSAELIDLKQIQQKTAVERDEARNMVTNHAKLFADKKVAQERMLKVTQKRVRKSAAEVPDALQSRGFENQIMSQLMLKARRRSVAASQGNIGKFVPSSNGDNYEDSIKSTMQKIQSTTSTARPTDIPLTYKREMIKCKMLMSEAGDVNQLLDQTNEKYSETKNRLNSVKYEQKQECDQLEREIERLEAECIEKEQKIKILDTDSAEQYEQVIKAIEAINAIKQKFEPDKMHENEANIPGTNLIQSALEALKSIEESIKHHSDDIGTGETVPPGRRTVCFDAESNDEKAEAEKLWDKTYDNSIVFSPLKRVQFTCERYSQTNLLEAKRLSDAQTFEDGDDGVNEHYVTRETILAMSKPKGRKKH